MAPVTKKRYTFSDYQQLPEGSPYQLIAGELVREPSPTPYHQLISWKLNLRLSDFVIKNDLGIVLSAPLDVYFSETETYQPDLLFISKDRLQIIGERKIEGPPDLIVEILSPSTAYYDLKPKKSQYAESGVKEYWIVDPVEKSVEVFENMEGKMVLFAQAAKAESISSRLFEGFRIALSEIF